MVYWEDKMVILINLLNNFIILGTGIVPIIVTKFNLSQYILLIGLTISSLLSMINSILFYKLSKDIKAKIYFFFVGIHIIYVPFDSSNYYSNIIKFIVPMIVSIYTMGWSIGRSFSQPRAE